MSTGGPRPETVFLFDEDKDRVITDRRHAVYLGALQRYRGEYPHDPPIHTWNRRPTAVAIDQ